MSQSLAPYREAIGNKAASPLDMLFAVLWSIVAISGWLWLGSMWVEALRPGPDRINDFYQDWGSARNHVLGLPVYTHHATSLPRHLGLSLRARQSIEYNAHPPAAVLMVLPLACLDYRNAALAWNLISLLAFAASLKIVARALDLSWMALPPALALLAFCHPLFGTVYLCQLTLVLVFLVTLIWDLERSGQSSRAGLVMGAAAAIKLFPAYLVLFHLARGRLRPAGAAAISFCALNLAAASVLGLEAFHDYLATVIPAQAQFSGCAYNLSIVGLWHKLFNPLIETGAVEALWLSPGLARWGAVLCNLAVTLVAAVCVRRARTALEREIAMGAVISAMLLVSPVTWDVSLPLLLVPIALLAHSANRSSSPGMLAVLVLILAIAWIPQNTLTQLALAHSGQPPGVFSWRFMLGAPSLKFYALLATFAMGTAAFRAEKRKPPVLASPCAS